MPPPQPSPPRLWGQDAAERELSRGSDYLRLTWDLVAGATDYELRVDGGPEQSAPPGTTVAGFQPNSLHAFDVRAVDGTGSSPWSPVFEMVTRPPTPAAPLQDEAAPTLWGVSLLWSASGSFPGGGVAAIEVWRRWNGTEAVVASGAPLASIKLDEDDPKMMPKQYWLRIVVPTAAVPGNPLPGDNVSFSSPELSARGPIVHRAVIPRGRSRSSALLWRSHYPGVFWR